MLIRESCSLPVAPHASMLRLHAQVMICSLELLPLCLFPSQNADMNILVYNTAANVAVDF